MAESEEITIPLLVVEDDADDQFFLQTAFEKIGFGGKVAYVDSARQLFEYLERMSATSRYPYAILLDYNMPATNGEEALVKLKETDSYKDIQVMIYSTSISDTQVKQLKDLGAEGCYIKAYSASEIVDFAKVLQQKITNALSINK
ncbi:MAG: response regulator [Chitinophagaceae bacterium]